MLYTIEKEVRGKPPDDRKGVRQARAGPLLAEVNTWLHEQLTLILAKPSLAQAIGYTLPRRTAFTRYHRGWEPGGRQHAAERSIRLIDASTRICAR